MQKKNEFTGYRIDILGKQPNVARLVFEREVKPNEDLSVLRTEFAGHLQTGVNEWVFDIAQLPFPTTKLIAFFVSATEQARHAGGELKIINVSESARNNLMTFSPLTYLEVDDGATDPVSELVAAEEQAPEEQPPKKSLLDFAEPDPWDDQNDTSEIIEITEPELLEEVQSTPDSELAVDEGDVQLRTATKGNVAQQSQRFYMKTESKASNLYKLCDFVVKHAEDAGMDEKQIGKTKIAVYEAALNVIEHAYHSRPDNWIELWVEYSQEYFKIILQDYGLSFEKKQSKGYDVEKAVEKRQTGGFGLHIIERSMDRVEYTPDPINGNQLVLFKNLSESHAN